MQFMFKMISGKTIMIEAELNHTVEHVKELIAAKEHLQPGMIRIVHAGRYLEDGKTMADYNIREHLLHIILKNSEV